MRITGEFNYRNARAVLDASAPGIIHEITSILGHPNNILNFEKAGNETSQNKSKIGSLLRVG